VTPDAVWEIVGAARQDAEEPDEVAARAARDEELE
tara:strand:+ start:675 stop:779 length:105 start_codon:yes stop_codon:yes gene_type:complete